MSDWPSFTPNDGVDEQRQAEFDAKRAELDAALHDTFLALLRAISSEAATPTDGGERLTHLARAFATLQDGDYVMYSEGRPGLGARFGAADTGAGIGQSARMSAEPLDRVKLMPEYGCDVPLWADGNLDIDDCRRLGLSVGLIDRLVAWQSEFDASFEFELAWSKNPAAREPWRAAAEVLAADLRRELPAVAITVDLWPVEGHP